MGAMGAVIGGSLLGLGAASLMSKKSGHSTAAETHSNMAAVRPSVPEPPVPAETGDDASTTQNALMEEAREKEKQAALLRQQQAREIFTSGLGAGGLAQTAKKTLLGG